jgi:hypothetical protein
MLLNKDDMAMYYLDEKTVFNMRWQAHLDPSFAISLIGRRKCKFLLDAAISITNDVDESLVSLIWTSIRWSELDGTLKTTW